jgi:hypothetical protein
MIIFALIL